MESDLVTEFQNTWNEFLAMRKKIKKPPTDYAKELLKKKLTKLSNGNVQLAIQIMNQSIIKSWQDFYPLKN